MNSSDDIIREGEELLEMRKQEEVIQQVLMIKDKIESKPIDTWSMDGLVDHIFTLAKIMDNLSELKDYAALSSEAAAEEYSSSVRDEYLRIKDGEVKVSDALAKAKAEQANEPFKRKEITMRYQARVMSDLYRDCDRLISFTQSKIKTASDSKIRSNFSGT